MARAARHMSSVKRERGGWAGAGRKLSGDVFCNDQSSRSCSLLFSSFIWYSRPCFALRLVFAAGLQAILPEYLKARFVQAALSYVGCNEEGQFVCKEGDCWCRCAAEYPQCNCPEVELRAMEASLSKIRDSWNAANRDFEESGW